MNEINWMAPRETVIGYQAQDGELPPAYMSEMERGERMTPSKRKRLLKTYGSWPEGYTSDDLEQFLDLLYGLFEEGADLRRLTVCNPFDRSDTPQHMRLVDLADWLEVVVA